MDTNTHYQSHDYAALLLRTTLGVTLLAHGLLKVMVFTIPGTVGFFASIGLPPIVAYLTIFGEVAGGLALIGGVYTRLVSLLSVPILLGASWVHMGNGWVFSNEGGGWEFPVILALLALGVALLGNGAYAIRKLPVLDALIPEKLKG
jgi:putative oxidoreductase